MVITVDDVPRVLNCLPALEKEKDWTDEHAIAAGVVAAALPPLEIDLRASWWEIGDQGATGSCVGWAVADSLIRWHFVRAHKLAENELLSIRYVWMAAKEIDEFVTRPTTFIELDGTSIKAALDVARDFGVVTDAVLPFHPNTLFPKTAETFYALAAGRRIAAYFNLGSDQDHWKVWLANHGPIAVRLNVDQTWTNTSPGNSILDEYRPMAQMAGHAAALVGYDHRGFIVRNSWGTAWGDQGYAYASPDYAAAAFTEAYGITVG